MLEFGCDCLRPEQVDRLHQAMAEIAGPEAWGEVRDRLVAIQKSQLTLSDCEAVLLGADSLRGANAIRPQSLRLLLAAAAWVWLKNSNHFPIEV